MSVKNYPALRISLVQHVVHTFNYALYVKPKLEAIHKNLPNYSQLIVPAPKWNRSSQAATIIVCRQLKVNNQVVDGKQGKSESDTNTFN
jgi:hypothetical protein